METNHQPVKSLSTIQAYRKRYSVWILVPCLFFSVSCYSQDCAPGAAVKDSLWIQSIKSKLNLVNGHLPDTGMFKKKIFTDSTGSLLIAKGDSLKSSIRVFLKNTDSTARKKHDPLLYFQQGYVQYNFNYRSRIDTPYAESDIIQHQSLVNGQFIIAGTLPVNVSYIERQSNSSLFMDYRDVRVDINGPELQRMQREKIKQSLMNQIQQAEDSTILPSLNRKQGERTNLRKILNSPQLVELLIQSKENIIHLPERDASCKWSDSIGIYSSKYIDLYETRELELDSLERGIDSLRDLYAAGKKKIQMLQKIINGRMNAGGSVGDLKKYLNDAGIDEGRLKYPGILYSLQRVSFGRTTPDISPLTVKNINVKGVNAAFGNGIWYAAFTAGVVDYRFRDFIYGKTKQSPQYVYAARVGLGRNEGNHFFLTGYKGDKQIYSTGSPSSSISGVSAELQYIWWKTHRLSVEVAQSSVPPVNTGPGKNTVWDFRDKTGRAWNLQWNSYFPGIKAEAGGFFQHTGLNFQSFNSYRVNAAADSWMLKYNQYFFNRQLRIDAIVRKNDFNNPLIAQRYESSTIFKTLQLSFRKRKWPSLSAGYIPSSQYVVVNDQVYESRYQTFTINANHFYQLGRFKGWTNTFYSKFYNSSSDSGFVYYNANYYSIFQKFMFRLYSSLHGVSITRNSQFRLAVYQEGIETMLFRKLQVEIGVKINQLNSDIVKAGAYGRMQVAVPLLGALSLWYDDSYLPGLGKQLTRNEQVNIGFTRRIK